MTAKGHPNAPLSRRERRKQRRLGRPRAFSLWGLGLRRRLFGLVGIGIVLGFVLAPVRWFLAPHHTRLEGAPAFERGSIPVDALVTPCDGCSTGGLVETKRFPEEAGWFYWRGSIGPGTVSAATPDGLARFEWANGQMPSALPPGLSKTPNVGDIFVTPAAQRWLEEHPDDARLLPSQKWQSLDAHRYGSPNAAVILIIRDGRFWPSGVGVEAEGFRPVGTPWRPAGFVLFDFEFGSFPWPWRVGLGSAYGIAVSPFLMFLGSAVVALVLAITAIGRRGRSDHQRELIVLGAGPAAAVRIAAADGMVIGAAAYASCLLLVRLASPLFDQVSGADLTSVVTFDAAQLVVFAAFASVAEVLGTVSARPRPVAALNNIERDDLSVVTVKMLAVSGSALLMLLGATFALPQNGHVEVARHVVIVGLALLCWAAVATPTVAWMSRLWQRLLGDVTGLISFGRPRLRQGAAAMALLGAVVGSTAAWAVVEEPTGGGTRKYVGTASDPAPPDGLYDLVRNSQSDELFSIGSTVSEATEMLGGIDDIEIVNITGRGSISDADLNSILIRSMNDVGWTDEATKARANRILDVVDGTDSPASTSPGVELSVAVTPAGYPQPGPGRAYLANPVVRPLTPGYPGAVVPDTFILFSVFFGSGDVAMKEFTDEIASGADQGLPSFPVLPYDRLIGSADVVIGTEVLPLTLVPAPVDDRTVVPAEIDRDAGAESNTAPEALLPVVLIDSSDAEILGDAEVNRVTFKLKDPALAQDAIRRLWFMDLETTNADSFKVGATILDALDTPDSDDAVSLQDASGWLDRATVGWPPMIPVGLVLASAVILAVTMSDDVRQRRGELDQLNASGATVVQRRRHIRAATLAPFLAGLSGSALVSALALWFGMDRWNVAVDGSLWWLVGLGACIIGLVAWLVPIRVIRR